MHRTTTITAIAPRMTDRIGPTIAMGFHPKIMPQQKTAAIIRITKTKLVLSSIFMSLPQNHAFDTITQWARPQILPLPDARA
jgi:hypothetical protein